MPWYKEMIVIPNFFFFFLKNNSIFRKVHDKYKKYKESPILPLRKVLFYPWVTTLF